MEIFSGTCPFSDFLINKNFEFSLFVALSDGNSGAGKFLQLTPQSAVSPDCGADSSHTCSQNRKNGGSSLFDDEADRLHPFLNLHTQSPARQPSSCTVLQCTHPITLSSSPWWLTGGWWKLLKPQMRMLWPTDRTPPPLVAQSLVAAVSAANTVWQVFIPTVTGTT